VLYAILKRGALLPIAPVVGRLTIRAIAIWYKDTPVGSPPTMCGLLRPVARRSLAASLSYRVATRRHDGACSADGVSRAQHPGQIRAPPRPGSPAHPWLCGGVANCRPGARLGWSATRPPAPAPQLAKEMSW